MIIIKEVEFIYMYEKEEVIILNLVNGNADLIDIKLAEHLKREQFNKIPTSIINNLIERKYIFKDYSSYMSFINNLDDQLLNELNKQAPNFIYIPSYDCNLKCYYCFEEAYEKSNNNTISMNENIYIVFDAIDKIIKSTELENNLTYNKSDILTDLTGGEPLLLENKNAIDNFLFNVHKNKYKCSIITNGTTLDDYIDIFIKYDVCSLQITLDGDRDIHDSIRISKDGQATFDKILDNISKVIENTEIDINIRVNLTNKNIDSLNQLQLSIDSINKNNRIYSYIYIMQQEGKSEESNIISEVECLKQVDKKFPNNLFNILFHGKDLIDNLDDGKFNPKIAICSAMSNQYILDFKGDIYKCWWGIGDSSKKIGTYSKEGVDIDYSKLSIYKNRTIFNSEKCKKCKYRYICGRGCTGNIDINSNKNSCPEYQKIIQYVVYKMFDKC